MRGLQPIHHRPKYWDKQQCRGIIACTSLGCLRMPKKPQEDTGRTVFLIFILPWKPFPPHLTFSSFLPWSSEQRGGTNRALPLGSITVTFTVFWLKYVCKGLFPVMSDSWVALCLMTLMTIWALNWGPHRLMIKIIDIQGAAPLFELVIVQTTSARSKLSCHNILLLIMETRRRYRKYYRLQNQGFNSLRQVGFESSLKCHSVWNTITISETRVEQNGGNTWCLSTVFCFSDMCDSTTEPHIHGLVVVSSLPHNLGWILIEFAFPTRTCSENPGHKQNKCSFAHGNARSSQWKPF